MITSPDRSGDCIVELDQAWVSSMKQRVEGSCYRQQRSEPCTIYRVPINFRKEDTNAYDPRIISLGPYHYGKKHLSTLEEHKWRYLQKFLSRNLKKSLEDYLKEIKALEARTRSCYSEDIDMGSEKFVEMLMLDGCFIIELLLMQTEKKYEEEVEEDPIQGTAWILPLIEFDMLILENQIPFFILQSLFDMVVILKEKYPTLIELALQFFGDLSPIKMRIPSRESVPKIHHLLHLFHSCILPSPKHDKPKLHKVIKNAFPEFWSHLLPIYKRHENRNDETQIESIPSATELREAGVQFKKKVHCSFLDVTFRNGILEISPLSIYDHTYPVCRNLIAFEQCYPKAGNHVATYAFFMDCLVDTPMDVALLQRRGILLNGLGSEEEAALLFNRLCQEVAINYETSYLASLFEDVKKHCSSKWPKWRAKLVRDYFSNPWAIISFAAAIILLILTILQTVFTVLAYVHPPPL